MLSGTLDNVLINGDFLRALWTRLPDPAVPVDCPVFRGTFAADRWCVRYARPAGASIRQAMSADLPDDLGADSSLELHGAAGVTEEVILCQRIESAEAPRYRRRLLFSAWLFASCAEASMHPPRLAINAAPERDIFDDARSEAAFSAILDPLPPKRWTRVEAEIDGRAFGSGGISLELAFPAPLLGNPAARIRIAGARLIDIGHLGREMERPAAIEALLAARYFQRLDLSNLNSLGRALAVNAHELYFQLAFPAMRAAPACTLPADDGHLQVFTLEGAAQRGFVFDATYRSRSSVIIRATRRDHGVRDGYLSFTGPEASILLDAEL